MGKQNCMIGFPNRIDAATLSGGSWARPLTKLKARQIGDVARSSNLAPASTQFVADLGGPKNIRVVDLRNHNLSLSAKYRIRAARALATNLVPNSMMQGAVAGTPGTIPTGWNNISIPANCQRQIIGVAVESGLTYIEFRIWGTPNVAGSGCAIYPTAPNSFPAAAGTQANFGLNVRLIAGAIPTLCYLGIDDINSGGSTGIGGSAVIIDPTEAASLGDQRFTTGRIGGAGGVVGTAYMRPYVWIPCNSGQAVDFTLRIAAPMFCTGLHSPAFIPTTGATASAPDFGDYDAETGLVASRHFMMPQTWRDWNFASIAGTRGADSLTLTTNGTDPQFSNDEAYIDGSRGYMLALKIRRLAGSSWDGSLFFETPNHGFSEATKCAVPPPVGNEWQIITVDLRKTAAGGSSDWATASHVKSIRFDFGGNNGFDDSFEIDFIQFGAPPAYESGWLKAWPAVMPFGAVEWEDDNWWSGSYTDEQKAGYIAAVTHVLPANVLARYWKVEFDDPFNLAGFVQLGRVFIGPAWQAANNMSFGASIGWETTTEVQEAYSGTEYFDVKTPFRVARFALDWMTEDEGMSNAFELQRQAGVDKEVMWIHDPTDTVHALRRRFLGRLRQLSPVEFPYANVTRNAFEIKELL